MPDREMTPLILRKRRPDVRASKDNSQSFPTLRRQCRIADNETEQLGGSPIAAAATFRRAGKNSRRSAPRLHVAPQISGREGPHGSAAPRLLRRTRPRPRQRAILDRGLSADRRNAEVARIEQSEIRDRAVKPAPDFVSLNPGYARYVRSLVGWAERSEAHAVQRCQTTAWARRFAPLPTLRLLRAHALRRF